MEVALPSQVPESVAPRVPRSCCVPPRAAHLLGRARSRSPRGLDDQTEPVPRTRPPSREETSRRSRRGKHGSSAHRDRTRDRAPAPPAADGPAGPHVDICAPSCSCCGSHRASSRWGQPRRLSGRGRPAYRAHAGERFLRLWDRDPCSPHRHLFLMFLSLDGSSSARCCCGEGTCSKARGLYADFRKGLVLQRGFEMWCNTARQPRVGGGQHDRPDRDRAKDGFGDPRY